MSAIVLEFSIFCIEEVAAKLQLPGNVVYDMLTKKPVFYQTILSHHTMSCIHKASNIS